MFSLIVDPATVQPTEGRSVALGADDIEELLMSWLNELIYLHESQSLLLVDFRVESFGAGAGAGAGGRELRAEVSGERYDPKRHTLELGIKACTFNGLEVAQGPPARVRVYFDV